MQRWTLLVLGWLVMFAGLVRSTGAQGTAEDYKRSEELSERWNGKVFRDNVTPNWSEDGSGFWYRNSTGKNLWEYVIVNCEEGTREPAFDHAALAEAVKKETSRPAFSRQLKVTAIEWEKNSPVRIVTVNDRRYQLGGEGSSVKVLEPIQEDAAKREAAQEDSDDKLSNDRPSGRRWLRRGLSPDGQARFKVSDGDLIISGGSGKQPREILRAPKMDRGAFTERNAEWSPDSTKLVVFRVQPGQEHLVYFVESSPTDQLQPKLHSNEYLKPGDEIPQPKPVLFNVKKQKVIEIDDELFSTPWLETPSIHWAPDSSKFYFVYNQRGHQVLRVICVDARTGKARTVIDEVSKTFVDYQYKQFLEYLDDTNEAIWMSERDGWNHLYLFDLATGEMKNPITTGEWVVRKVIRVDRDQRMLWFECSGVHPDQDPYYIHFGRVNFDGTDLKILTQEDGTHKIELSPNGRYFVDSWSRVDLAPQTDLRNAKTGELVCELERANDRALRAANWIAPERFSALARDNKTPIYGVIYRPSNFDPQKKYPVIEKIYAGPHGSFVPKDFRPFLSQQEIAEVGFIVVQIDGMGTSNRSKAFHDVCWKNLGDSGFPDRIKWIKAAAAKYPEFDLSNGVGIYGGSAGGQSSTRAMLAHGDFYKVAVSDCGCHDNRMDKIWWNELWMGWPIGPHYEEQSNTTNAHKLTGKLFLTVGEMDTNVDPASTFQVVNALVKANKDVDFMVVPGRGHGVGEIPYMKRKRIDYFVQHLMGKTPPAWESN